MIWDSLPDCLLETIYKKIVISQPNNLLKDIKSYKNTIDYINDKFNSAPNSQLSPVPKRGEPRACEEVRDIDAYTL